MAAFFLFQFTIFCKLEYVETLTLSMGKAVSLPLWAIYFTIRGKDNKQIHCGQDSHSALQRLIQTTAVWYHNSYGTFQFFEGSKKQKNAKDIMPGVKSSLHSGFNYLLLQPCKAYWT